MLLKKYKIVKKVRFEKCKFIKCIDKRVCIHCKFFLKSTNDHRCCFPSCCFPIMVNDKLLPLMSLCKKSTEYINTTRKKHKLTNEEFTSYIPDQKLYVFDRITREIKKIEEI